MLPCKKRASGAYGARYIKRAERLARSISSPVGKKNEVLDGVLLSGGRVNGLLSASCIELPAHGVFVPSGFIPYSGKKTWGANENLLDPTRLYAGVDRNLFNPSSSGEVGLADPHRRASWSGSFWWNRVVISRGLQISNYIRPIVSNRASNIGEAGLMRPASVSTGKHGIYSIMLVGSGYEIGNSNDLSVWVLMQRRRSVSAAPEIFTIGADYLRSNLQGYSFLMLNAAFFFSSKIIEVNEHEFVAVFSAVRGLGAQIPGAPSTDSGAIDRTLVMVRVNTSDPDDLRMDFSLFPTHLLGPSLSSNVKADVSFDPFKAEIQDVSLTSTTANLYPVRSQVRLRVDDIGLAPDGSVTTAIKVDGYVQAPDEGLSWQRMMMTIAFGRASWGGPGASFFEMHSIEIQTTLSSMAAEYGWSADKVLMGDRQIMMGSDVYRWAIPARRRQDATTGMMLVDCLPPYIIELKNGVPTGVTGDDEGTLPVAFGSSMDIDDDFSELLFLDFQYNVGVGVAATRDNFNLAYGDFQRDSMNGGKGVFSDTGFAFPAGGRIIPYGADQKGETYSIRSDGIGVTFIDGERRKYEKVLDSEDFSPYGEIGPALTGSIAFQNSYIVHIDCFQKEVRTEDGVLSMPAGFALTVPVPMKDWVDGNPATRVFVRRGPIWTEDEDEDGAPEGGYWVEIKYGADDAYAWEQPGGSACKFMFLGWPQAVNPIGSSFLGDKNNEL